MEKYNCGQCGAEFYAQPSNRRKNCSKACQTEAQKGKRREKSTGPTAYWKPKDPKKRKCLKCQKMFDSSDSGNRICAGCVPKVDRERTSLE